ncbi:MAG: hypothetical protein H5T62_14230 [Anaerolineae bacterium]|nr:hypothetical protein [Anaerolineae bacterium]
MGRPLVSHPWLRMLTCALIVVVLAGCSGRATETPVHLPPVRVLSARARLEEAWRLALEWRDDAELKQIQASVIGPAQVGPLYVDFDFESPSEDQLQYAVMCSPASCVGQEFAVPYLIGYGAIEFDEEMIDSVEAAIIGLQHGGKPFAYAKGATMWVRLGRDKPRDVGPTVWLAYYASWDEPLYVVIDPYTGEVIRIE